MSPFTFRLISVVVCVWLSGSTSTVQACPGCTPTGPTFAEDIGVMDVAVIARLVSLPMPPKGGKADQGELPVGKFEVNQVLKGASVSRPKDIVETLYLGEAKVGTSFLILGIDPKMVRWSTPLPLSSRAPAYLEKVVKLPKEGEQRLEFFQRHLEDEDFEIARDAYNEFARASHDAVKSLKGSMNRDKLVGWIQNQDVPPNHRRLYLLMLGICGSERDWPMLEKVIKSKDRKDKQGLDAVISCYLQLRGEAGVPLIEDLYLKDKKGDYSETYSAIIALRFQLTDGKAVPTKRALEALRYMLDRPDLADLVIPDLARWEDWDQADKLFELYKSAGDKSSFVRVPIIAYLRVCPLPKAKDLLRECERIDPEAMQRASTLFLNKPVPSPPKS